MTQADWGTFFVAQMRAAGGRVRALVDDELLQVRQPVAEVRGFDATKHLGDKGLRSLDRLTKLLVVAAFLVDRVAEALLVIGGLLVFSIFGTVPHQNVATFGVETFVGGGIVWIVTTALMTRSLRNRPGRVAIRYAILRVALMQTATLSTVIAGALLATGHDAGFFWLVPATLISYIAGIGNAWALTVEILR